MEKECKSYSGLKGSTRLTIKFDFLKKHPHKITRDFILVLTLLLRWSSHECCSLARPLEKGREHWWVASQEIVLVN